MAIQSSIKTFVTSSISPTIIVVETLYFCPSNLIFSAVQPFITVFFIPPLDLSIILPAIADFLCESLIIVKSFAEQSYISTFTGLSDLPFSCIPPAYPKIPAIVSDALFCIEVCSTEQFFNITSDEVNAKIPADTPNPVSLHFSIIVELLFLQSSITIFSLLIVDAIPETLPSPLIFPVLVDNLIVTFLFLFIDFANIPDASSFASISPLLLHSLIITSFSAFAIIPADVPFSPASALIFPLLFEFIILVFAFV